MNQIWNRNHYLLPRLDFFVSSTMLILCPMSLGTSSLECACISVAFPGQKLLNKRGIFFLNLGLSLSWKYFDTLKFKTSRTCELTKFCVTYSSTDNFLSPIPVSGWLIFCCGNLILYQKRNENNKNATFLMQNKKKYH